MPPAQTRYLQALAAFMDFYRNTDVYSRSCKERTLCKTTMNELRNMPADAIAGKTFITDEDLYQVAPEDIERFMIFKAFGLENHLLNDIPEAARVLNWRSGTLLTYKRSLSYFMPSNNTPWNDVTKSGNPTRSTAVNRLIRFTRKKEVREEGLESKARRELTLSEFEATLQKLNSFKNCVIKQFMIPAVIKFQFAMIARIDDTCHVLEHDLKRHSKFPFALCVKIRWSKNVVDERDAAEQILLGAMNRNYCILLALAIYLEVWTESMKGIDNDFLFGSSRNPDTTKSYVSKILKKDVFDDDNFIREREEPIGTHSIRKLPATYAGNTCSTSAVETRGRWKRAGGRIVGVYISNELPYADAKVASALCVGGPCQYVLKENTGINDEWLLEHVVPHTVTRSKFRDNEQVALVLALPLLWASFDADMEDFIPPDVRLRVRNAYHEIHQLPFDENPVKKVPILVLQDENGSLCIDPISCDADNDGNLPEDNNANIRRELALLQAVYTRVVALQHENQDVRVQLQQLRTLIREINNNINERLDTQTHAFQRTIRRVLRRPALPLRRPALPLHNAEPNAIAEDPGDHVPDAADEDGEDIAIPAARLARPAILCKRPSSLYVLWQEWETGVGGNLAAKNFNIRQRGACTVKYCRRKVVWDQIQRMINSGYHNSDTAVDAIYAKYGDRLEVTKIIQAMKRDLKAARLAGRNYIEI